MSGIYNITCATCTGRRVVPKLDEKYKEVISVLEKMSEQDHKEAAERLREIRMGY